MNNTHSNQEALTTSTLFDRIGGRPVLVAAVEIFYQRVLNDPIVSSFFVGLDLKKQKTKSTKF